MIYIELVLDLPPLKREVSQKAADEKPSQESLKTIGNFIKIIIKDVKFYGKLIAEIENIKQKCRIKLAEEIDLAPYGLASQKKLILEYAADIDGIDISSEIATLHFVLYQDKAFARHLQRLHAKKVKDLHIRRNLLIRVIL